MLPDNQGNGRSRSFVLPFSFTINYTSVIISFLELPFNGPSMKSLLKFREENRLPAVYFFTSESQFYFFAPGNFIP